MLKIVVQIKEQKDNVYVDIKKIDEKQYIKSTRKEKMTAMALENAIIAMISGISTEKKEGED